MPRWPIYWVSQLIICKFFKFLSFLSSITFGVLFLRIRVDGKENLTGIKGPIILAPNHKTYIDHFFIGANIPITSRIFPIRSMAADWLFTIDQWPGKLRKRWFLFKPLGFLTRWSLHILGAYPVQKGKGLGVSLRNPLRILEKGHSILIYPEGGINYKRGVQEARIGPAFLAKESGAPILPIAIKGAEFFTFKSFFFGKRVIHVSFGKLFLVDSSKDLKIIAEEIRKEIEILYNNIKMPE